MLAKYIIVKDGSFEVPILFSELTDHSRMGRNWPEVISAGKVAYNEDNLSVSRGSVTLNMTEPNEERQKKDAEIIEQFIKRWYY